MATNRNFGKLVNGSLVNAPDALVIVTTTTEDYEVCVNAEAVEMEGAEPVYEHRTREVVTRRVELHPDAADYANPNAHSYYDDSDVGPWLHISPSAPSDPAPDGKHYEVVGLEEHNGELVRVFALVDDPPPPPRTFSKLKAIGALKAQLGWSDEQAEEILAQCVAQ